MQNIKEILIKLGEAKLKRRELKKIVTAAFIGSKPYNEILEKYKQAKAQKDTLETEIMRTLPQEHEQLERLKLEIEGLETMISDTALSMFMKGENIEVVTDTARFEPKFKVTFTRQMKLL